MKRNSTKFILLFLILSFFSCTKEVAYGPDPYAGGKKSLSINFEDIAPSPSQGKEGTKMTFKVHGLLSNETKIHFFINEIESEVVNVTDSTLTAILPKNVSTGGVKVVIDGQVFAGPICKVIGKTAIDLTFRAGVGAVGPIYAIQKTSNNQYFIGGSFINYNGYASAGPIFGLARISAHGDFVTGMKFGDAVKEGSVNSISEMPNGDLLISGNFLKYDTVALVKSMAVISNSGTLNSNSMEILNLTSDPLKSFLNVPSFNGGVNFGAVKSFVQNNYTYVIGNFNNYAKNFYSRSTFDNILSDAFPMRSAIRMDLKGNLDSTYNVNMNKNPIVGEDATDGGVQDGYLQSDGKMILVGSFTRFNVSTTVGRIVRLNANGKLDESFNVGTGANDNINNIYYSSYSKKYILTGSFNNFNGIAVNGIVVLNLDGSVDQSFKGHLFDGGIPTYVQQMSNGLILVSGTFKKYNNIVREGLMILNPDGTLAEGYNNTGKLYGSIYDGIEGTNNLGQRTVILVGNFSKFNGQSDIGNIMRLTFQD